MEERTEAPFRSGGRTQVFPGSIMFPGGPPCHVVAPFTSTRTPPLLRSVDQVTVLRPIGPMERGKTGQTPVD